MQQRKHPNVDSEKQSPRCRGCGREFAPGAFWSAANSCRVAYLLPIIAEHPGISAWELSQAAGMDFATVSKAMTKARAVFADAVQWEPEPRESGDGIRYRFTVTPAWPEAVRRWLAHDRELERDRR